MELGSGTSNTKVSDSGYSNSCSNSNSQRSGSSKSRLSGSNSSGSSGYGGNSTKNNVSSNDSCGKHAKEKEHKKKKLRCSTSSTNSPTACSPTVIEGSSSNKRSSKTVQSPPRFETEATKTEESSINPQKNKEIPEEGKIQNVSSCKEETAGEDITDWNNGVAVNHEPQEENSGKITNVSSDDSLDSFTKANCNDLEDGFCCVISMYDGVVLYTTPSLTNLLGFPKDMWLGRSFIDFVHPKDRETFSAQVTTGITIPLTDSAGKNVKNSFYVFLRKYKGLKTTGFGVVEKTVSYQAFQLTATFRHINDSQETKHPSNIGGIFLIIVAVPVTSSFKAPNEKKKLPKFNMHHTAASTVTYVDSDVVSNFGFLPQDILGRSVFDFYHPEDMPLLKEVYEAALRECQVAGTVHRSKPYRFAVQNGGFATVETDWSCFFNPWSRKLEIVIGLHNILRGPKNPDVFNPPLEGRQKCFPEAILKESDVLKEQILNLLNNELSRPADVAKQEVTKRCKDLAKFIEKVMAEVAKPNIKPESPENSSVNALEQDFVVLGEISPHNDYYDRTSSETLPSYYQLNYNENIHRFFESKPRTKESDESGQPSTGADSEQERQERKSVSPAQDDSLSSVGKCLSPVQNNGITGAGSGSGKLSSASNVNMETMGNNGSNGSSDSYSSPHLTQALLSKHNEEMERIMRKRFKEYRSSIKERDGKPHKSNKKVMVNVINKNEEIQNMFGHPHGVKRSGSRSWEGEHHKMSKHKHQLNQVLSKADGGPGDNISGTMRTRDVSGKENYCAQGIHDTSLWPPFSLTVTPITNAYTVSTNNGGKDGGYAGFFPVYFLPAQGESPGGAMDPNRTPMHVPYMPGMMFSNSMFPAPSLFCQQAAMVPLPLQQPLQHQNMSDSNKESFFESTDYTHNHSSISASSLQRPSSQSTSIKAEPGSGIGSVASASCFNRAIEPKQSPNVPETQESYGTYDGCSHSSLCSSFLKTDTGSDPNDSSSSDRNNKSSDDSYKKPTSYPMRNRDPPWLETVSVTPDLIYRYQVATKTMEEILAADLNCLKEIHQPALVNDQLDQLYLEMELQGLSTRLTLEEGVTSSSSSGDEIPVSRQKVKKKRKSYSSLMMIYEENAPFPPPDSPSAD